MALSRRSVRTACPQPSSTSGQQLCRGSERIALKSARTVSFGSGPLRSVLRPTCVASCGAAGRVAASDSGASWPALDATWRWTIKSLYLGDVRTFHHKDDLVRTRRPLSADDGCAAAQHAAVIQHLSHGSGRRRDGNRRQARAFANALGPCAAMVVEPAKRTASGNIQCSR